MKIYNSYILTTAIVLLLTTVILVATGQNSLDVYFTVYTIETLVITELNVYFNAKARHGLTSVSALLFAGFLVIVAIHILKILL